MDHPFLVGQSYRNRIGDYVVVALQGDRMTIRYGDGKEQSVRIELQKQIWESIQDEESPPPKPKHDADDDGLDTAPVRDLVNEVLHSRFASPYPQDITDQVCLAIEADPHWLTQYDALVMHFSSQGKDGKLTVNSSIGWFTKELTGLVNLGVEGQAKSGLIKSYSRLGSEPRVTAATRQAPALWSQLSRLAGQTLLTLGEQKPFDVLRVVPSHVDILIHATRNERAVPMAEIEPAWNYLRQTHLMTLSEIRENGYSEVNPVYVAALLAELPGVTQGREPQGAVGRPLVVLRYAAEG